MKQLIIVRHAKSSWEYDVGDHDRPLKIRGINDAYRVANYLKKKNFLVDCVFSSPANRALHTCIMFMNTLEFSFKKLHIDNMMYDFGGSSVLQLLRALPDNLETVMVFGHNHALTRLVNELGNKYTENLPTSGVAIIQFEQKKWKSIKKGLTKEIITPKQLK